MTVAGLLKRGSVPALVFGKAITSRIDWVLQRMDISRSNPEWNARVTLTRSIQLVEASTPTERDSTMWRSATLESLH